MNLERMFENIQPPKAERKERERRKPKPEWKAEFERLNKMSEEVVNEMKQCFIKTRRLAADKDFLWRTIERDWNEWCDMQWDQDRGDIILYEDGLSDDEKKPTKDGALASLKKLLAE